MVGTNFSGGAFSVSEVFDGTTESDCLQFDPLTTDPKKARWQRIGGIKFKADRGAEGGLGHGLSRRSFAPLEEDVSEAVIDFDEYINS